MGVEGHARVANRHMRPVASSRRLDVWSLATSSGMLDALSPTDGLVLGQLSVGSVPHFASSTPWDNLVLVGTLGGVVAVRPGGRGAT